MKCRALRSNGSRWVPAESPEHIAEALTLSLPKLRNEVCYGERSSKTSRERVLTEGNRSMLSGRKLQKRAMRISNGQHDPAVLCIALT